MIDKEKANLNMKKQWAKLAVVLFLYALCIVWVQPRSITGWLLTLAGALLLFISLAVQRKARQLHEA